MPTYEYVCGKCGNEFERFQSILAEPVKKCPECGKNAVTRKIGIGGAVLFKGGGFYETDYRSEGYTKAAEAEQGEAKPKESGDARADGEAATKTEAKADAKPAAKPETKPEPKSEPASKATHRSRVGRGIGNIVQNPPKPKTVAKTKPGKKSRRK